MVQLAPDFGLLISPLMLHLEALRYHLMYRPLTSGGLAIGTGATTAVKVVNTVTYLFNGVFKSKTTAEVAFTATTHNIAANASTVQEQVYAICLNAAGTLSIIPGGITSGAGTAPLPANPVGDFSLAATGALCVIGYVRIAVAAGATSFVAGTTALSDGALTVAYTNAVATVPSFYYPQ